MRFLQNKLSSINDDDKLRKGVKYINVGLGLLILGLFLIGWGIVGAATGLPLSAFLR